jgi:hypothetical protein
MLSTVTSPSRRFSPDPEVEDGKYVLLFLHQQFASHNFNFGEAGFFQANPLILKEIDSSKRNNIGIEV